MKLIAHSVLMLTMLSLGLLAAPSTGRCVTGLAQGLGSIDELTSLSLEALMQITVTSVSRKPESLAKSAAAVFVITGEDIQRSGATTIADALRMAPGVNVAQLDANKWAVSIRGRNGRFANKLLVLMDGRSVYSPLFSGVFWELQDTALEDIDRIEVIRGPGAAMWGANAVNGVINIITKSAAATSGGLVSIAAGSEERSLATVRYGFPLGEAADLRIYGKYRERDDSVDLAGENVRDGWDMARGGFRFDARPTGNDQVTVQGDYYAGTLEETYRLPLPPAVYPPQSRETDTDVRGGNLLARWSRTLADASSLSLQLYYDHSTRDMFILNERRDVADLDFQHRFTLGEGHDLVWGLGYRYTRDDLDNTFTMAFAPDQRSDRLYSAFVQDEISLVPERLKLILGTRIEHNDYSGVEVQPTARLLWTPDRQQTVWAAVSRAVRTPARSDHDVRYRQTSRLAATGLTPPYPATIPVLVEFNTNDDFDSEELLAYELGYRIEPNSQLSLDLAAFYYDYEGLRSLAMDGFAMPSTEHPGYGVQSMTINNALNGGAYGVELVVDWRPRPWWHLQAVYDFYRMEEDLAVGDRNPASVDNMKTDEEMSPRHNFSVRSEFDLPHDISLDLWLRGASRIAYANGYSFPAYTTLDARIAWKPAKNLELSVVGQNLFDHYRGELVETLIDTTSTQVERGFYGQLRWWF